jgi:hypothetical protein
MYQQEVERLANLPDNEWVELLKEFLRPDLEKDPVDPEALIRAAKLSGRYKGFPLLWQTKPVPLNETQQHFLQQSLVEPQSKLDQMTGQTWPVRDARRLARLPKDIWDAMLRSYGRRGPDWTIQSTMDLTQVLRLSMTGS